MEGESGEQVAGELESVTSSAQGVLCKAGEMRQEVDSRDEVMHSEMSDLWFLEKKMCGRERVTTDEERVARGAEQRSGCADRLSSGKSFIGKRKKFIFNAFVDFKPM